MDFGIVTPHASPHYLLEQWFIPLQHLLKHQHQV